MSRLSHVNDAGQASMVDVSAKPETARTAVAEGSVRMLPATLRAILENSAVKGDVLAVARVAGIQGAKRCADLIPLCHPLPLSRVSVDFAASGDTHLEIRAECRVTGRTGVEMEALTAVSVAALTVYDMCKAVDRGMVIEQIRLCSKEGGKSGPWRRGQPEENTESVAGTAESVAQNAESVAKNAESVAKNAESVARNAESVAKTTKDGGGPVP